jgi:hypothetical protein
MLAISHATDHLGQYLLWGRLMSDYEVTLVNDNSKSYIALLLLEYLLTACSSVRLPPLSQSRTD